MIFAWTLLGGGMMLAAIGATEAVRSWMDHGGFGQALLGVAVCAIGVWLTAVAALRLLA